MRITRGVANLKRTAKGIALAIGNYDGVHLGHQHVLAGMLQQARLMGLTSTVMSFEPHPRSFFSPQHAPVRLSPLREKMQILAQLGIDNLLILPFNQRLAQMNATDFIRQILVEKLASQCLFVGHDFRFGHQRQGNWHLLVQEGLRQGFTVNEVEPFLIDGVRVSSSLIRQHLMHGELAQANRLLGRCFSRRGRVQHGARLGRQWGFPTANLHLDQQSCPLAYGIYVVQVQTAQFGLQPAVASFGVRPTLGQVLQPMLEVHLLDGQFELYGEWVEVAFLHKMRDEVKYDSIEALKTAIAADCQAAKEYFLLQKTVC